MKPQDLEILICANGFIVRPRYGNDYQGIPQKDSVFVFQTPKQLAEWIESWAFNAQVEMAKAGK